MALGQMEPADLALFTTGLISREAFGVGDRKTNFYMIGSMGLLSSLGLGLALNTSRRVFIFDGDGSLLMDLGAMANIGQRKPGNLVHVVLDNEAYQSTGGQPTVSAGTRLDQVARSLGYPTALKAAGAPALRRCLERISKYPGPAFLWVKTLDSPVGHPPRVDLTPDELTHRIRRVLMEDRPCRP